MTLPETALVVCFLMFGACIATAAAEESENDAHARRFVEQFEKTFHPMETEAAQLAWTANITGKEEDFAKKQAAEERIELALSDPAKFAELKSLRQAGVADARLARQIDLLYLRYLDCQIPPELLKRISERSNAAERAFNVFRPVVNGKEISENEVRRVLRESRDSAERKAVWEAGKKAGAAVVGDLLALVKLRNEAARKLGFANYHSMQLALCEQDEKQLVALFDELEELTREPFHAAKREIDAALAAHCGISVEQLRPWHYQDPFFQESPAGPNEIPESVYKPLDSVEACRKFYEGIGLPIDDVLKRSDLYERPGKCPHAFMTDIDREGDIRILENVVPGREWLGTTLHELGHATYSKHIPRELPYVLRNEAHMFCTEGIAMMFERFALNADWLTAHGAKIADPEKFRADARRIQRNRLLIFARYCQVMFRFERELYANPDQNLNKLWWDLVEKYQEIRRPDGRNAPDYAAKYHFVGAPVYYHNYMMGEMFASQLHHALVKKLNLAAGPAAARPFDIAYFNRKDAGEWIRTNVFATGLTLKWNEMIRRATGEPFSAKAFAEDLTNP